MKFFAILFCFLVVSHIAQAKNDVDFKTFNNQINQNIDWVVEENPHIYETKSINRAPASVEKDDGADKNIQTLDEVEEQADTHTNW